MAKTISAREVAIVSVFVKKARSNKTIIISWDKKIRPNAAGVARRSDISSDFS